MIRRVSVVRLFWGGKGRKCDVYVFFFLSVREMQGDRILMSTQLSASVVLCGVTVVSHSNTSPHRHEVWVVVEKNETQHLRDDG